MDGYDLDIDHTRGEGLPSSPPLCPNSRSAAIYYAGHGISVDLVPTDIVLKNSADLDLNAISVSRLVKQMKRDDRVIVIFDACGDNPFVAELEAQNSAARCRARTEPREFQRASVASYLLAFTLVATGEACANSPPPPPTESVARARARWAEAQRLPRPTMRPRHHSGAVPDDGAGRLGPYIRR